MIVLLYKVFYSQNLSFEHIVIFIYFRIFVHENQ